MVQFFSQQDRIKYDLKNGDNINGFTLKNNVFYPEENIKLFHLEHDQLGSHYYHFDCNDQNNAMGIIFKTLSENSKGVPHILEHVSLCGSKKFPVRDPFFNMIQRSLNTYMNAWTGPDFTMYPFSTQNQKDFQNLLSVYCDAVFNMLLNKEDFLQEGWRKEFNSEGKLQFKGVVFNEMKGNYQSQDRYFHQLMMQELLSGTHYQYDSGGDPKEIINLSYEEFINFSKKFYHPSNCSFVSYGNFDFRNHIKFIEENYLRNQQRLQIDFNEQKVKLERPKTLFIEGPNEAMELKENFNAQGCLNFVIGKVKNELDILGLNLLTLLLFEYPNSIFQKEILEKELASGYCESYGFEVNCSHPFFSIGFKGLENDEKKLEKMKTKIIKLLQKLCEKKIDRDFIASVLHQVELTSKVDQSNKGIKLFELFYHSFNEKTESQFDIYFSISKSIEQIKEKMMSEDYFENLIQKYLLNNQRQLYIVLKPNKEFLNKNQKQEDEILMQMQQNITIEEQQKIMQEAQNLKTHQEKLQDLNVLPTLVLSDIPLEQKQIKILKQKIDNVELNLINNIDNGVSSIRIKLDITNFPQSMTNYLFLIQQFINQVGTEKYNYEEFSQLVNSISTGIDVKNNCYSEFDEKGQVRHFMSFETKCLDRNLEKVFNMFSHFFHSVNFKDFKRLSQLIQMEGAQAANQLSNDSLQFCLSVAKGAISLPSNINNQFRNTKFLADYSSKFMQGLMHREYLEDLQFQFDYIKSILVRRHRMSILVHTNEQNNNLIEKLTKVFVKEMEFSFKNFDVNEEIIQNELFQPIFLKQYFSFPSYVNFVAESFQAPYFQHPDYPKLQVASKVLDHFLHKIVREKGGAYGSFVSTENRVTTISSYRDPNYLQTYLAFEQSVKELLKNTFTDQELDGAKLKLFQKIDAVRKKEDQGLEEFYYNLKQEEYQKFRNQCKIVSREDIIDVVGKYLLEPIERGQTAQVIFGSDQNNLEGLVTKGWKINKFSDVFAFKNKQSILKLIEEQKGYNK